MDNFKFLNKVIDNLKIASVFIIDAEGIITRINEGVGKTFGYKLEDLAGKYFGILFTEEDHARKKPQIELATVLEKGEASDCNFVLHKSGAKIWVNGESVLAGNEIGENVVIKIIYDINDQKVLEDFLYKKNHALLKANNDLNTFVYTASHDLKAPISNIEALIAYLKEEITEDCKQKTEVGQIFEMIDVSIERFKNTINDLASTGKAVSEDFEDNNTTHFQEILEDVKSNLQELIQKYKPIISEDFSRAPFLNLSRKNLRSILHNLLSNALKFSSADRIPQIEISSQKQGGFIILKVSDNGMGIKEEDQGKIFSMYERVHDHIDGTGVGLNIVKRIMDNAGGQIEIQSKFGDGTIFLLKFRNN